MNDVIEENSNLPLSVNALTALPRWNELPDLELYMDQVLSLTDRYLSGLPEDQKRLTGSMVNNYVKLGMMPAPVKKKYGPAHLAYLIMICVLKSVLPIASIRDLISFHLQNSTIAECYDRFCSCYLQAGQAASESMQSLLNQESPETAALSAALRSEAEQALALRLMEAKKVENI